jgi:DnaJ domain
VATFRRLAPGTDESSSYARLGLALDASVADIKRAYRRRMMEVHPDHAGGGRLAEFLAVQSAYETLLTRPSSAISSDRPASSPDGRVARRPHRDPGPGPAPAYASEPRTRPAAGYAPEPRGRSTMWAGARWYWEGLWANSAKRVPRERAR